LNRYHKENSKINDLREMMYKKSVIMIRDEVIDDVFSFEWRSKKEE